MFKVLTVGNPKTLKGQSKGYLTAILHLAPARLSGFNVCPMATEGCKAACLNTAGRGGIAKGGMLTAAVIASGQRTNYIQEARARKTRAFFQDREGFMLSVAAEITKAQRVAKEHGLKLAVRLNGTSDIRWEVVPVTVSGVETYPNLMAMFPDVAFYDYTKIANRRNLPSNYKLTFSLADGNGAHAVTALQAGMNVAAVFRDKATVGRYLGLGTYRLGPRNVPVVDGDETDLRFLDPAGVIVALYAKGNARKDASGFVRD